MNDELKIMFQQSLDKEISGENGAEIATWSENAALDDVQEYLLARREFIRRLPAIVLVNNSTGDRILETKQGLPFGCTFSSAEGLIFRRYFESELKAKEENEKMMLVAGYIPFMQTQGGLYRITWESTTGIYLTVPQRRPDEVGLESDTDYCYVDLTLSKNIPIVLFPTFANAFEDIYAILAPTRFLVPILSVIDGGVYSAKQMRSISQNEH